MNYFRNSTMRLAVTSRRLLCNTLPDHSLLAQVRTASATSRIGSLRDGSKNVSSRRPQPAATEVGARNKIRRRASPVQHRGIAFQDVLEFLQEEYGVHPKTLREPLAELAQILGYNCSHASTQIRASDLEILLEEMGMDSSSVRGLIRFLRSRQKSGAKADTKDSTADSLEIAEWGRILNTKDLLAHARKQGAHVEMPMPMFLRVATANGTIIHFKFVGKKDTTRGRNNSRELPMMTDLEDVRICSNKEVPLALTTEDGSPAELEEQDAKATFVEPAPKRHVKKETPSNFMRRESVGCSGPRRRGPRPQFFEE